MTTINKQHDSESTSFTEDEVRQLCLKSMNKGMGLRQDQLAGYSSSKSGNEILNEWLDVIISRKESGLNILG